jgi:hypothetical protein
MGQDNDPNKNAHCWVLTLLQSTPRSKPRMRRLEAEQSLSISVELV